MGTLDLQRVDAALTATNFSGKLHHFTRIDSTQNAALQAAERGEQAGQVYIADEQTSGRGRGGHTWFSGPEDGLYLSILLRPRLVGASVLKLSLAAGLAAQSALRSSAAYAADLRWPNDIVTVPDAGSGGARKLGGILTESALTADGTLKHAVLGIGLNLGQSTFPAQLGGLATSLLRETGRRHGREEVLVCLLLELEAELQRLQNEDDASAPQPSLQERFCLASSWGRGKRVHVHEAESYTGTTDGLDPSGLLRVCCEDGSIRLVRHGGVREA